MDRGREGRRGGNGPVSAPRRARTSGGFKDITGAEDDDLMDDVHTSRLRERLKKETTSVYSLKKVVSASGVSHSRTKRKRQELQIQVHSSLMDEGDDATDDTDGLSEEDDDDEPPPTIPRWPGKPKLQTKYLDVESISVEQLAIPRKTRSAMVKRPHELSTHNVECVASNPSPAPPPSPHHASPSHVLSSSSNVATKRTKLIGSKARTSKALKNVTLLSENEVEVAEALSDFARLMVNQAHRTTFDAGLNIKPNLLSIEHSIAASEIPAFKSETAVFSTPFAKATDGEPATSVSPVRNSGSTIQAIPPVVSSMQLDLVSGEVTTPKRKCPGVESRIEDGPNLQMRDLVDVGIGEAVNAGAPLFSKEYAEADVISESKSSSANILLSVTDTPLNTEISHSPSRIDKLSVEWRLADPKVLISDDVTAKSESFHGDKQDEEALDVSKESGVAENFYSAHLFLDKEMETVGNSSNVLDDAAFVSAETRELPIRPASTDLVPLIDVDPMVSPNVQQEHASVVSTSDQFAAQDVGNVEVATPVKMSWLEKERQRLKENSLELLKEKGGNALKKEPKLDEGTTFSGCEGGKEDTEVLNNEGNMSKQVFPLGRDSPSTLPLESMNTEKAVDRPVSSELPSSSSSVCESSTKLVANAASNATTVPVAFSLAGWPKCLPSVRYYGSAAAAAAAMAAAAWSGVSCLAGPTMSNEKTTSSVQLPPYIMKPPQARKRCSTHVYIAHLIALQQCIAHHSFFSNPFGSSSASYITSSRMLNPLFPSFEAILNRNAEVCPRIGATAAASAQVSVRGATVLTPEVAASFSLEPGEKEREIASVSDNTSKRHATVSQLFSAQIPSTTLQAGLPLLFPPAAATSGVGNRINGSAHGLKSNTNVITNGNFFNAMNHDAAIQQNNLTFSFPPPHLASLTFGGAPYLSGQQAAQYFSSPYYGMQLMHPPPPQIQSLPEIVAGVTQKQAQAQGVRTFLTTGSSQHQQQSCPHSPIKSPQRLHQKLEKEGNVEVGDGSGKRGVTPQFRNSQDQQHTNSQTSNQSSYTNSFLGTGLQVLSGHIQDFDFMTQLSGKQAIKTPQSKSSPHTQIQQQSLQSPKQQQSVVIQQQIGGGSAPAMSLKEVEAQTSQTFGNISSRLPATSQGLEALAMNNMGRAGPDRQTYGKVSDAKGSKAYDPSSILKTSVSPGPVELAPVAAVMAPQGHLVFQNMMDLARSYAQQQERNHLIGQSLSHSILQSQSQQDRSLQLERAVARGEEVHILLDGNAFGDVGGGREVLDDRNVSLKRAVAISSRAEIDPLSSILESPQSANDGSLHPHMSGISSALTCVTMNLSSRPITPTSGIAPVGTHSASHQSKQAGVKAKATASSGTAAISMSPHSFPTYSDRLLSGVSSSKLQLQQGHVIPSMQSSRQIQAFGNAQSKSSQKAALGPLAPVQQAHPVLASAISKIQGQQQLRNLPGPASTIAASRISSAVSTASASPPILMHQSPAVSKSSGKVAPSGKGSGSVPQKYMGGNLGKKSTVPTQIGGGDTAQGLPSKSSNQQHQLLPSLQQYSSLPASAQQQPSYAMLQQASLNQTHQQLTDKSSFQRRQQLQIRHHTSIQQQQLLHSHVQQQSQSNAVSQPQQPPSLHLRPSHHLLQPQQPQPTLTHLQSLANSGLPNPDGASQALTTGAPYARLTSDGTPLNQAATVKGSPRSAARQSTGFTQGNSTSLRTISTGPSSIHSQLGLNGTSLGQPQAMSPLFNSVGGVYTPANANQVIAKSSGQKKLSEDSTLEQMNTVSAPKSSQKTGSHHVYDGKQPDSYSGKVG